MGTYTTFGQWLRQRRRAYDLTQEQLADKVGCALETIRKIEVGTRRASRQMAELVAENLGVPPDQVADVVTLARAAGEGKEILWESPLADEMASLQVPDAQARRMPPKSNLPVQRTTFVGRITELDAICAMITGGEAALVTLIGPPGTGKTRLGLQVAQRLKDNFRDGVYFVPFASVTGPEGVVPAIKSALQVGVAVGQTGVDALQSYLQDREVLLLVDNCEHLPDVGILAGKLLSTCPSLKVLATSRTLLHVYGEQEFHVPPLTVPEPLTALNSARSLEYESVQLFVDRATAVDPTFELTDENAPIITEICRRLDALPLAIELAATRCRVLPPRAILSRLTTRLSLLSWSGKDLHGRQQTLRGAITWSYNLLEPSEAQLFRRFAIFAGGASLDAVEAICLPRDENHGPDSLEVITALLDASLVERRDTPDGEPRFAMLETIREFAEGELLKSGESEAMYKRHALHYLQVAEASVVAMGVPYEERWLRILESEHDNLRVALKWCLQTGAHAAGIADIAGNAGELVVTGEGSTKGDSGTGLRLATALGWFWYLNNHFEEGRYWLGQALDRAGTSRRSAEGATALRAAGWLANIQGDLVVSHLLADESVAYWRSLDRDLTAIERREYALSLTMLGITMAAQGDVQDGYSLIEEAVSLLRTSTYRWPLAFALGCLADATTWQANYELATTLYESSLVIYRDLNDLRGSGQALQAIGALYLKAGNYAEATVSLEHALDIETRLGDKRNLALAYLTLGDALIRQGDHAGAKSHYEEALYLFRELGVRRGAFASLRYLSYLAQEEGDYDRAVQLFEEYGKQVSGPGSGPSKLAYLAGISGLAVAVDKACEAARLLAYLELQRRSGALFLGETDIERYDLGLHKALDALSPEAWREAQVLAATMTLDEAMEYAAYLLSLCSLFRRKAAPQVVAGASKPS